MAVAEFGVYAGTALRKAACFTRATVEDMLTHS